MAFPTNLTNAVDGVTEVVADHLNNLETKVGIDGSLVTTSLDYLLKNLASIDPGHNHSDSSLIGLNASKLLAGSGAVAITAGGSNQNVTLTPSGVGQNILVGRSRISGAQAYWPLTIDNSNTMFSAIAFESNGTIYGYVGNGLGLVAGSATDIGIRAENNFFFAAGAVLSVMILSNGNVGIGTASPNISALLHLSSTTKGFLPPVMTTTQKTAISSPPAGLMVYDSTLNKLCVYTGSAWEAIASA